MMCLSCYPGKGIVVSFVFCHSDIMVIDDIDAGRRLSVGMTLSMGELRVSIGELVILVYTNVLS
jgi:hypothetical protein